MPSIDCAASAPRAVRRMVGTHPPLRRGAALACCALIGLAWACANPPPGAASATNGGDDVRDDLRILRGTRILFAHQSVGTNLLDGVQQLSREEGEPLDIVEITADSKARSAGFSHLLIGQNGSPKSKLSMFPWVLRGFSDAPFDLALLKFCYLDVNAGSDVTQVFTAYRDLIRTLEKRYPRTVFVHATMPLRASDGVRGTINKWLGRWNTEADNEKRNEFNALLRATYSSAPLFDLAAVESTSPDGRRSTFACGGWVCETLAREYTTDGGHLNALGSRIAATALIRRLAGSRRQQLAMSAAAVATGPAPHPLNE